MHGQLVSHDKLPHRVMSSDLTERTLVLLTVTRILRVSHHSDQEGSHDLFDHGDGSLSLEVSPPFP